MFCTLCGKPYADGSRFCTNCGKPLQAGAYQPIYAQPMYVAQQPAPIPCVPVSTPVGEVTLQSYAPPAPAVKGDPMIPVLILVLMAIFGLGAYVVSYILEII